MDRCPDCSYSLAIHFRKGSGPRVGEYIGCPKLVSASMGQAELHPRIVFRVVTRRGLTPPVERYGRVIALWADYQDDDGQVLVWDVETGDQWMGDLEYWTDRSRRPTPDQCRDARGELEYRIGGPIRPVFSAYKRKHQREAT